MYDLLVEQQFLAIVTEPVLFGNFKKALELEKYAFHISKDRTIGANTFQVQFDSFNKKVQIIV